MKTILFATNNPTKATRFSEGLLKNNIKVVSLVDINLDIEIEETGKDSIENALIKARACSKLTNMSTFGMDDSLYIENIPDELQPGMFVRRVNDERLNDDEMLKHYSSLARKYGTDGKLTARWVYGLAVIKDGIEKTYTWNKEDFYIVENPSNIINPGYPLNSISVNKKLNKYFTDLTEEDREIIKEDEMDVVEFITENV